MKIRAELKKMPVDELLELTAFYEDVLGVHDDQVRTVALRSAFGLQPAAAWLLSRLAAADGRLFRRDALADYLPSRDTAEERGIKIVDVHMVKVRKAIGDDAIETVWGVGWRLTPLGLLRVRRALNEDLQL